MPLTPLIIIFFISMPPMLMLFLPSFITPLSPAAYAMPLPLFAALPPFSDAVAITSPPTPATMMFA